jgi:RNA polymerase sigma-70 factor, ECF subfamily
MSPSDRPQYERTMRAAVLAGDERAWRAWYDETFDELLRYVRWRCGGRADWADEVVQETWMTAVRRIRRFDPDRASFATWLWGIAANVLRNHLRRQKTLRRRVGPLDGQPLVAVDKEHEDERREQSRRIMRTLDALPEQYETVLRAKYVERQSVAEIAAASDETAKAIESRLGRARRAFRETYEKFQGNGKADVKETSHDSL